MSIRSDNERTEPQALARAEGPRPGAPGKPAARYGTPWRRFAHNRLTQVSAALLTVFVVTSLVTLPFSLRWYNVQELDKAV